MGNEPSVPATSYSAIEALLNGRDPGSFDGSKYLISAGSVPVPTENALVSIGSDGMSLNAIWTKRVGPKPKPKPVSKGRGGIESQQSDTTSHVTVFDAKVGRMYVIPGGSADALSFRQVCQLATSSSAMVNRIIMDVNPNAAQDTVLVFLETKKIYVFQFIHSTRFDGFMDMVTATLESDGIGHTTFGVLNVSDSNESEINQLRDFEEVYSHFRTKGGYACDVCGRSLGKDEMFVHCQVTNTGTCLPCACLKSPRLALGPALEYAFPTVKATREGYGVLYFAATGPSIIFKTFYSYNEALVAILLAAGRTDLV